MAITWMQLVQHTHLKSVPEIQLFRTVRTEQAYAEHKAELKRSGMTSEQQILSENPGMLDQIVFQQNLFPYCVEPGIVHTIAWLPPKLGEMKGLDVYVSQVLEARHAEQRFGPNFVVFENPMTLRSIKGLRHLHVFYRK